MLVLIFSMTYTILRKLVTEIANRCILVNLIVFDLIWTPSSLLSESLLMFFEYFKHKRFRFYRFNY